MLRASILKRDTRRGNSTSCQLSVKWLEAGDKIIRLSGDLRDKCSTRNTVPGMHVRQSPTRSILPSSVISLHLPIGSLEQQKTKPVTLKLKAKRMRVTGASRKGVKVWDSFEKIANRFFELQI